MQNDAVFITDVAGKQYPFMHAIFSNVYEDAG